ncbi:hypothetical protein HUG15_19910 [Salicibibacter cibarius]|uniref:Uncharacterized protein n=1 Tax=Salicibibacter cibarius TaxID=2743000 RepID=A0A7T6Z651_9BACI|nr:hypothetical protein [Salicibibacter cibarius]QQK77626.1 hypothetical protein HUG15_19910 [Salicibibacter cibarius]
MKDRTWNILFVVVLAIIITIAFSTSYSATEGDSVLVENTGIMVTLVGIICVCGYLLFLSFIRGFESEKKVTFRTYIKTGILIIIAFSVLAMIRL